MKQFYKLEKAARHLVTLVLCFLFSTGAARAQAANCDGITNMYGVYIKTTSTAGVQILPMQYSNGALGTAVNPGTFTVNPVSGSSTGTATLAVSPISRRFFYMSRDVDEKRIYAMDPVTGSRVRIRNTPSSLNNQHFVKLAGAQDGHIYGLATNAITADSAGSTRLVRFTDCFTTDCSTVSTLGFLSAVNMPNWDQFNGDICFDALGDMYIFGSKYTRNASTGVYSYSDCKIYRVRAADIPTSAGTGTINVQYMGHIPSLYGTVVSGAAFDAYGNFYFCSANQTAATSALYMGTAITWNTAVAQITTLGTPPSGYFLTDLASCTYPNLAVLDDAKLKINATKSAVGVNISFEVEEQKSVKEYIVEKKAPHYREFISIRNFPASSQIKYTVHDKEEITPGNTQYRIRTLANNGQSSYSTTVNISSQGTNTAASLKSTVFTHQIEGELMADNPEAASFELFDHTGRRVGHEKIKMTTGTNNWRLSGLAHLPKGLYILRVLSKQPQTFKLIKQ